MPLGGFWGGGHLELKKEVLRGILTTFGLCRVTPVISQEIIGHFLPRLASTRTASAILGLRSQWQEELGLRVRGLISRLHFCCFHENFPWFCGDKMLWELPFIIANAQVFANGLTKRRSISPYLSRCCFMAGPVAFGRQHFRGEVGDRANCLLYSWKAEDEEAPGAPGPFKIHLSVTRRLPLNPFCNSTLLETMSLTQRPLGWWFSTCWS